MQLSDATKLLMEKFPGSGKFIAHRDTAGRPASEMFAGDILKVLQALDTKGAAVKFCCDSISMRSVKVSTMLFSEEEPIIAHKMALMEKAISELLAGQKTLFTLVGEKLQESPKSSMSVGSSGTSVPTTASSLTPATGPPGPPVSYAATAARVLSGVSTVIQRNKTGQARAKRINSIVDTENELDDVDEEGWEVTAEVRRREKLRKRLEERKIYEDRQKKIDENKKKTQFIVGTGAKIASKDGDCPGQAAPKHVFVARTAMSTTKETVEGCLEYLSGIKGEATCCTPQERLDSGEAFSLSWRVQVDSCDFDKALQPSSWKTGWAIKPYFFRRKRPERHLGQGQGHLENLQAGQGVHLSHGVHP